MQYRIDYGYEGYLECQCVVGVAGQFCEIHNCYRDFNDEPCYPTPRNPCELYGYRQVINSQYFCEFDFPGQINLNVTERVVETQLPLLDLFLNPFNIYGNAFENTTDCFIPYAYLVFNQAKLCHGTTENTFTVVASPTIMCKVYQEVELAGINGNYFIYIEVQFFISIQVTCFYDQILYIAQPYENCMTYNTSGFIEEGCGDLYIVAYQCPVGYYMIFTGDFCQPCLGCGPGQYCNDVGECTCFHDYLSYDNNSYCAPPACAPGFYGPECIKCPDCVAPSYCEDGLNGTGTCICGLTPINNDFEIYYPLVSLCTSQHCGLNNDCSGHGTCVNGLIFNYCICDQTHSGIYCENSNSVPALCDCGVRWPASENGVGIFLQSDIPAGTLPMLPPGPEQYNLTQLVSVGSYEQAQYLCERDVFCTYFFFWFDEAYSKTVGINTYHAYFAQKDLTQTTSIPLNIEALVESYGLITLFQIDRTNLYNCPSSVLDVDFYFQPILPLSDQSWARFADVLNVCNTIVSQLGTEADLYPLCPGSATSPEPDIIYWTDYEWRYYGHLARFNPNADCFLTPVAYDPATLCHNPRCESTTPTTDPCNDNGFCVANVGQEPEFPINTNPYICQCKVFNYGNAGVGLNGLAAYIGVACEFSVATLCVKGGDSVLCSGNNNDKCIATEAWNGEFQLDPTDLNNFPASNGFDYSIYSAYIPYCDCDGTSWTGQFCETSYCADDPSGDACESIGHGSCVQNPSSRAWACQCDQLGTGEFCQYEAATCLDPFTNLKCAGVGSCEFSSSNLTSYCVCDEGYFGITCQHSTCSPTIMIPGHGVCEDGVISHCYPVYTGSNCGIDLCTASGGTILGSPPSFCSCPLPLRNLYQGVVSIECWPQCPIVDGQLCGRTSDPIALPNTCLQYVTGNTYSALCQCASGYILNSQGTCIPFCIHGQVPLTWSSLHPIACNCDIGYTNNYGSLTCADPICQNNGVYNINTSTCDCVPPFNPKSFCQSSTCLRGNTLAGEVQVVVVGEQYQCLCNPPFAPLNPTLPYDCNGNICGSRGQVYPFITSNTPANQLCYCKGVKISTSCSSNATSCLSYCDSNTCLNGGQPNSVGSACICPPGFANGAAGNCEINLRALCNNKGLTPSVDPVSCSCTFPYKNGLSKSCDDTYCNLTLSTGAATDGTHSCQCLPGNEGTYCTILTCSGHGLFNATTKVCQCNPGWINFGCDVSIPLSSSSASSSSANYSSSSFHNSSSSSSHHSSSSSTAMNLASPVSSSSNSLTGTDAIIIYCVIGAVAVAAIIAMVYFINAAQANAAQATAYQNEIRLVEELGLLK